MTFNPVIVAVAVLGFAGTAQAITPAAKDSTAADYVGACDAYGAGFFRLPGSDTCLSVGGYVRFELRRASSSLDIVFDTRTQLTFDARTSTEVGPLRSFLELWMQNGSGEDNRVDIVLRNAFVQFAGLTAGRASSNFDFIQGGYNIGNIEPDGSDRRVNLFSYTFAFGNGISATLGIEDQTTSDAALGFTAGPNTNLKVPNIVGNIAIAQSWGRAQLSGAIGQSRVTAWDDPRTGFPFFPIIESITASKRGYAVGAGIEVNLPMLGAGDKVFLQGVYTKGAVSYALNNSPYWVSDWAPGNFGYPQSRAWSISGGLTHDVSRQIVVDLGASYLRYTDPSGYYDYRSWIIGGDIAWKPASGLTLAIAFDHRSFAAPYLFFIPDWVGTLRVQRNF